MRKNFLLSFIALCFGSIYSAYATTRYVSTTGLNVSPYTNWTDAATTIQAAINVSTASDTIYVTNGVYATGGVVVSPGTVTNRIALTNGVIVQSVNGPGVTTIEGGGSFGLAAIRCAYVGNGSQLIGFTLTNGFTDNRSSSTPTNYNRGGGAFCVGTAVVANCIIVNCTAVYGGGISSGTVKNCYIAYNTCSQGGGGSYYANLNASTSEYNIARDGGGAYFGTHSNTTFSGNIVPRNGGALYSGYAYNCSFVNNRSTNSGNGGGSYSSVVFNCSFISNSARYGGGAAEGSVFSSSFLYNFALRGGGAYAFDTFMYITNSVFDSNVAMVSPLYVVGASAICSGGGIYNGNVYNSTIVNNVASNNGGGAINGSVTRCIIDGNRANVRGGGAYNVVATLCIVTHNLCYTNGGGLSGGEGGAFSTAINCTIVSNTAYELGGGIYNSYATNCLIYYNSSSNYADDGSGSTVSSNYINYCFTTPMPDYGTGNVTGTAPTFVSRADGDYYIDPSWPYFDQGIDMGLTSDFGDHALIDGDGDGVAEADFGAFESYSALVDIDNDYLSDADEVYDYGTDYTDPDTDGGGLLDGCEVAVGGGPLDGTDDSGLLGLDPDGDGYSNLEECDAGTDLVDINSHPNTAPVVAFVSTAQTSTDGAGLVTITNTVYDFDNDTNQLEVLFSTNSGSAWANAWISSASASAGSVTIDNASARQILNISSTSSTNTLTLVWETTNGVSPITVSPNTLVRLQAYDGIETGNAETSGAFLVDNEAPTELGGLTGSVPVATWTSNNTFGISWSPASDGAGIGLAGYSYAITDGIGTPPSTVVTTDTNGSVGPVVDGTNYYVVLTALDNYGNATPILNLGPFWISTVSPSSAAATVTILTSAYGDYVVGDSVGANWDGFSSPSGITGYYMSFSDGSGTTSGTFTSDTNGTLSGALTDQTNTFYVWPEDGAGHLGLASSANVLVLSTDGDWDADRYSNAQEEAAGTDALDPSSHPDTPAEITLISAAQTSTGGEGYVTITNTFYDFDNDLSGLTILYSTNNGLSWAPAWIDTASAAYGSLTLSSGTAPQVQDIASTNGATQVTNVISITWNSTNGPNPVLLSTNTLIQLQSSDGTSVTSAPIFIDNEEPSGLGGLTGSVPVATWTSNNTFGISWSPASDGAGIGLAGYSYAITDGIGTPPNTVITTDTNGLVGPLENGTNYYVVLAALDNYGNASKVISLGPFWIDTNYVDTSDLDLDPPDHSAAFVTIQTSEFGNYAVGPDVSASWGGFTDTVAIAGYYVSFINNQGTTNGTFTSETNGILSGAALDQTNTLYVWAVDTSTNIGLAAGASVYVLDPNGDPDIDGYTSLDEEVLGTSATNGASVFQQSITLTNSAGNKASVRWTYATNRTYILYASPNAITHSPIQITTNPPYVISTNWATWIETNSVSGATNCNFWIGVLKAP